MFSFTPYIINSFGTQLRKLKYRFNIFDKYLETVFRHMGSFKKYIAD